MKLSDRIALLKAGYSKDEIASMIEDDKAVEEPAAPAAAVPEDNPVLNALVEEVKSLKTAMQQQNINNTEISTPKPADQAMEVLASLINPKPIKEDK